MSHVSPDPDISIIVAWQKTQAEITECLDSLFAQKTSFRYEIILVYGGFKPSNLDDLTARYEGLRIAEHEQSGSIPMLHGLGVALSAAPLISITEAHTTFAHDWIEQAVKVSTENDAAATGGVVDPGLALSSVDLALYFCDYVQFANPLHSSVSEDLPGNNIVFKRSEITHLLSGKRLKEDGFWKTFFCHELMREGKVLRRDSRLVAYYNRHLSLSDVMVRRYHHGRCFGAMRSAEFAPAKKAAYAAACMALPAVLDLRLFKKVRTKPNLLMRFVAVAPTCHMIMAAWGFGEYCGTAFGAAGSCDEL